MRTKPIDTVNKLWIDESGDPGFKFNYGSTKHFIIGFVYLNIDQKEIDKGVRKIKEQITQLKSKLHLTSDYEFKFSRCKDKFRKEFLKLIIKFPIKYKVIVVNKRKLKAPALQYRPKELYCELVRRLLYDNNPPLEKATLIIDEAVAKIHQKEFKGVLRRYLTKNIVRKIQQQRSKSEDMIQIIDMIGGSVFRKYEKGEHNYYRLIKNKEKILIEF
ncbi:DUF3800 domain-containing protein [bacterium]|nr:DUF3800 domain-containing protein [bacterium]